MKKFLRSLLAYMLLGVILARLLPDVFRSGSNRTTPILSDFEHERSEP
jgi:hypothetical protein